MYRGKGVREYLEVASLTAWPRSPSVEAFVQNRIAHLDEPLRNPDEALRFFGTNSIPYVSAALRARDSWGNRVLANMAPWLPVHVRHANAERFMALSAYHKILQQGYWGIAGAACENEVRALLADPPPVSMLATNVLADIHSLRRAGQLPHGLRKVTMPYPTSSSSNRFFFAPAGAP